MSKATFIAVFFVGAAFGASMLSLALRFIADEHFMCQQTTQAVLTHYTPQAVVSRHKRNPLPADAAVVF